MDTLGIIFYNVMLRNVVCPGYYLSLPVTCPAKDGDIHFIGTGKRVGVVKDIMMPMALLTAGCIGIIH